MQQFTLQDFCSPEQRNILLKNIYQENILDICVSYESDFRNAKILRELTDDICREFGVSPKWRTRIVLIIDELNNNAIEYGSARWDMNHLYILVQRDWENSIFVKASVADTWKWQHAKTSEEMERLRHNHENKDFTEHHSIRGRGLFLIISRLVDSLNFKNNQGGWLIVQVEKHLQENSQK